VKSQIGPFGILPTISSVENGYCQLGTITALQQTKGLTNSAFQVLVIIRQIYEKQTYSVKYRAVSRGIMTSVKETVF